MAYVVLTSRVAGNPILVSDWNKNKNNWDATIDTVSGKIETDLVVADSIAADAVGTAEIATNGVGQAEIAAASVGQGELKTSSEEVSQSASIDTWYDKQFASFEYGFNYQHKASGGTSAMTHITAQSGISSYSNWVSLKTTGAGTQTVYAFMRSVTASPPYALPGIEDEEWGQFLWVVRLADGTILSARRCEEPPWAAKARRAGLPKNHPASLYLSPNPFSGDTLIPGGGPGEMPPGATIVLIDLREFREPVKRNRCARELAAVQARRDEFLGLGLPVELVDQQEAAAAKAAKEEATQNAEWENELERVDAKTEENIRRLGSPEMRTYTAWVPRESAIAYPGAEELQRTTVRRGEKLNQVMLLLRWQEEYRRRTEHEMAAVIPSLQRKAEKRRAWLTRQLFRRTRMDDIAQDLESSGKSILQALHESEPHRPDEDKKRPVVEECCGVNWKAIREADATLAGGADVPGLKEAGIRVVGK